MAWIKRNLDVGTEADNADLYAGGAAVVATIATVAALWAIGQ